MFRLLETIPSVSVAVPAARPPTLKPLQSSVTLFASMLIALPESMAVDRSPFRHHVPCDEITTGIDVIVPVQAS